MLIYMCLFVIKLFAKRTNLRIHVLPNEVYLFNTLVKVTLRLFIYIEIMNILQMMIHF